MMKINVIVIGNYLNGFSANRIYSYLLQLRLPNIILAEPAIHVYHSLFGSPLEMVNNSNHFAYLEPITTPVYASMDNDIQYTHIPNIISQESDVIDLEPSPSNTSAQSNTQLK